MKDEEGERGCCETLIYGSIQELSTDSAKSLNGGGYISAQKGAKEGLDREMSIMEDTLNQSMTVVTGRGNES